MLLVLSSETLRTNILVNPVLTFFSIWFIRFHQGSITSERVSIDELVWEIIVQVHT